MLQLVSPHATSPSWVWLSLVAGSGGTEQGRRTPEGENTSTEVSPDPSYPPVMRITEISQTNLSCVHKSIKDLHHPIITPSSISGVFKKFSPIENGQNETKSNLFFEKRKPL